MQARRKRPDREIFARFPPYLVPTYPGDAELFRSPGFAAWLPKDLPLVRAELGEVMEMDESPPPDLPLSQPPPSQGEERGPKP